MACIQRVGYMEFLVLPGAPALSGRVVRFYEEERDLKYPSYLAHTFYLENDEPASSAVDKHTRFLREHFAPAYDGIIDDDAAEGVEFVVVAPGDFHNCRLYMRACANPRRTYRVWARGETTDWAWRQFLASRDHVAPFHAPFITGNAVPPPVALWRGQPVVMRDYHRATGACSFYFSEELAELIRGGVMHAAARGEEGATVALRAAVEPGKLTTNSIPWYDALLSYEPHTAQWGKVGRLYGLTGEKAALNGEIVVVNRLWADADTQVFAECVFFNEDLLGPVDVPEGRVASAEYIQTPAKLQMHLEMPTSVHTMVGLVAKTAFCYLDKNGSVASRVRIFETTDGSVVCDKKSLRAGLAWLGVQGNGWWGDKLRGCMHAMTNSEGSAFGDDPNRVMLTLRSLRGLAEHCANAGRCPAEKTLAAEPEEDDWFDASAAAVRPPSARGHSHRARKARKGKRLRKKRHRGRRK